MTDSIERNPGGEVPLESWKEVAGHLQRDVRTVIRWEKKEGLPIHRHHHLSRSSVYAYPSELDAWRANRKPLPAARRHVWWRPAPAFACSTVIALSLVMAGGGPRGGSLLQAADGIVARQVWRVALTTDGAPSPDGRYLAFFDKRGLAVRDLTTGEIRLLSHGDGGSPVFSPDGKRVAYSSCRQGGCNEIEVARMDGSEPRVLYRAEKQEIAPADWSQDGKSILALRWRLEPDHDADIVSISAAEGSLTVLKSFGPGPDPASARTRLSRDGRFVAYDFPAGKTGNRDIFVLPLAGGQAGPVIQHPAQDQLLGWAPDGNSILFLSDRTGTWAAWLVSVADGKAQGQPTLLKREAGPMEPIGFTRGGSFFYKIRDDGLNVYTATLGGAAPSLLVEQSLGWNFRSVWSPDGKRIAYLSRRWRGSDSATLCIRSMETGEERDYAEQVKDLRSLQWSGDGSSLLLRGRGGLYTIGIQTEDVNRMSWWPARAYGSYSVEPCWSADGKAIYYVEPRVSTPERKARLVRADLATGREEVVRVFPEEVTAGAVLLSPDGRSFFLHLIRGGKWRPAVMPVGASEIRDLPGPWTIPNVVPRSFTWAPGSDQIVFIRHPGSPADISTSELWSVPVQGGEQRSLGFRVSEDVQFPVSINPDGKRLTFTAWQPATEFWAMENFLPPSAEAAGRRGK